MSLSGLERLGKVAGIGGISIGAVVLLLNPLIGTIPSLPSDQQADIVRLLAILGFGIGVIGVVAWSASGRAASRKVATAGRQSPAIKARRNVDIGYAGAAPERPAVSRSAQMARPSSDAAAQTLGDQSPAVASEGDVSVHYGTPAEPGDGKKNDASRG
jgi:hypothetical protein